MVAAGLIIASFFKSESRSSLFVTAAGAVVLVVVLLVPGLTEFQVDVLGLGARASIRTREQQLEAMCRRECRRIASFVSLTGVQDSQVNSVVEEAIEDTCRLWRGPVDDELVSRLLVCRAARLIQSSLRLGGPYRVPTPEPTGGHGAAWAAFAALAPLDRLVVALVEWVELDDLSVAEILDLEVREVRLARDRFMSPTGQIGGPT